MADVFAGRLHAGQHLVTQDLAERFGVSHTPIREALIALAGSGIIDLVPNRGAVVREVTAKEVREVCQVRRVLESEAVRRACGRIDLQTLEKLAADLRLLEKSRPAHADPKYIERARAVDSRLHDTIAAACDNAFLARELARLKTLFRALRDVSWAYARSRNDYRRLAGEAREHLLIVEALLAGDAKAATRAMSAHIRSGVRYWTRALPAARGAGDSPARRGAGCLTTKSNGKQASNGKGNATIRSNGKPSNPRSRSLHA